jgi:hypothetical protein
MFMKVEVPAGAVQLGESEDGRLAIRLTAAGMEGMILLDPQNFQPEEGRELGGMFWRVYERWLAARAAK